MALEVRQGLVTVKAARNYGVVVADGQADELATEALRDKMRVARVSALPLINYGPTIEDLRYASIAETGLPAPKAPRWTNAFSPLAGVPE